MRVLASLLLLSLWALLAASNPVKFPTPLQKFVWTDDGSFRYVTYREPNNNGNSMTYFLNVSTTKWLTPKDSTASLWFCYVLITVPNDLDPSASSWAYLYIDGGDFPETPRVPDTEGIMFAENSKAIMVHLFDVPNQPVLFSSDPLKKWRDEDAIIAYDRGFCWLHFFKNPRAVQWLPRLPMVKSAVKAMDAAQGFLSSGNFTMPQRFLAMGASKRGWTTWLMPSVDARVGAIAPMVLPMLNMVPTLNDMWRTLGEWTWALGDYTALNIMDWLWTEQFAEMARIIDPIVYLKYLAKVPKYLLFATSDEFFLPDATRNFYPELEGETHLRMVENVNHGLWPFRRQALFDIIAFADLVFHNEPRPHFLHEKITYSNDTASIWVMPSQAPNFALRWEAPTVNKTARDFRMQNCSKGYDQCFQPNIWYPYPLLPNPDGSYSASVTAPQEGWIGFMIELTFNTKFPHLGSNGYTITSQVNVVPDRYPFPSWRPAHPPARPEVDLR